MVIPKTCDTVFAYNMLASLSFISALCRAIVVSIGEVSGVDSSSEVALIFTV